MEKRRIILDVDTGHDDAVAIALAAGLDDCIKIEALIACAGNQGVEKTLENTLNMAEVLDLDCPVFKGASSPLVRKQVTAGTIHGENGFSGPVFPPRVKHENRGNGIRWALDYVINNPGEITYVSVGPWTDLATCIKADERFAKSLKEIVLMGGAIDHPGNTTWSAEFNVFADPEAASIVMQCGAPITMMGLDVTLQVKLTDEIMDKVRAMKDSKYKKVFLDSMSYYIPSILEHVGEMPAMHDPCCIAYLADPSIFSFSHRPVVVETKGESTYGKTTGGKEDKSQNVKEGMGVDSDKFWALFLKAISKLK